MASRFRRNNKINWKKLQTNQCPQCYADLNEAYDSLRKMFICRCGFAISEFKMKSIINDIVNRKLEREQLKREEQDEVQSF